MSTRVLRFPDSSIGELRIKDVTTTDTPLQAKGEVEVPPGGSVHLILSEGVDPEPLAGLPGDALEILTMSDTHDDRVLEAAAHLSGLKRLRCIKARVTDNGLRHIEGLSSLERLFLIEAPITDEGLSHLTKLKALTHLDLTGCNITDAGVAHLSKVPGLRLIVLSGTEVTDKCMSSFGSFERLSSIMLDGTSVTPRGLGALPELPYLHVWIGDLESSDENEHQRWREARPDLIVNGVRHRQMPRA